MKRLFVDSFILKLAINKVGKENAKKLFQAEIDAGNVLVCSEASAIDNAVFRANVDWFKKYLISGQIVVEVYQGNPGDAASGIRAMVNKKFEWSSFDGKVTEWEGEFEDLVKTMPDQQRLLKLYKAVVKYALPKGAWAMGPWKTPDFFTEEQLKELGLEAKQAGNRSVVFNLMKEHGYPTEVYIDYTREYLGGLVSQHHCDDVALLTRI